MTQRVRRRGVLEPGADGAPGIRFAPDCHGCGAARGSRWLPLALLHTHTDAAVGQAVELTVRGDGLARVAALLFGLPVLGLAAGAWLGSAVAGETASGALGALGFLLALLPAMRVDPSRLVAWLGPRVGLPARDDYRPSNGPKL